MARIVDDPRNTPTTSPPAPKPNAPARPSGQSTHRDFAIAVLKAIGAPANEPNIAFLLGWMQMEGTSAAFNPMATTENEPGATQFNSVGVKNYPNFETGVAAEARNLQGSHYPTILSAIRSGDPTGAFNAVDEWGVYSGNANNPAGAQHYASTVQANFRRFLGDPTAGGATLGSSLAASSNFATAGTVSTKFPEYAWLMSDPEIGSLLTRAASQNWDDATFQSAVQATNWYRTHSDTVRQWESLKNTDPATYHQRIGENNNIVGQKATDLGVNVTLQQIAALADAYGRYNWNDSDLTRALIADSAAKPASQGGTLGENMQQVRHIADSWGVTLNDKQAYMYAANVAEGGDLNSVSGTFMQQAKALYPHYAKQFDQGLTLRDVAQPYLQQAGTLLEQNPDTISLADPKFNRALAPNQHGQPLSQYEWSSMLMSDPSYGWDHTQNARDNALNLTTQLAKTMGVVPT